LAAEPFSPVTETGEDFQNPQHWRARAEEARARANDMSSPELKERMLVIAADYDRLAEFVQRQNTNAR
jgi:hypothetical protein